MKAYREAKEEEAEEEGVHVSREDGEVDNDGAAPFDDNGEEGVEQEHTGSKAQEQQDGLGGPVQCGQLIPL